MATLSILSYNLLQGLDIKMDNGKTTPSMGSSLSKTFTKITVQNVLSENNPNSINISKNTANTIVRKIKDFGMYGSVNSGNPVSTNSVNSNLNASSGIAGRKRPRIEATISSGKVSPGDDGKPSKITVSTVAESKAPKLSKEPKAPKTISKKTSNEAGSRVKAMARAANSTGAGAAKPAGTPGRKGLPLPLAVARRNARERNRVKQVNNGFAALRERIPEEVAEAFETQSSSRNAAKKLSKVETLRMAVEYIRNLERLLGFDYAPNENRNRSAEGSNSAQGSSSSSGEDSFSFIKDELDSLSPGLDDHFDDSISNYDVDEFFTNNSMNQSEFGEVETSTNTLDLLPSITTLNGLQYMRIPGTSTYQLLSPEMFASATHSPPTSSNDDERFCALIDDNCLNPELATSSSSPPSIRSASDGHSLSPTVIMTADATTATATASSNETGALTPATTTTTTPTTPQMNGECVNTETATATATATATTAKQSLLSRSPVPQHQPATSTPSSSPNGSSSLHQRPQRAERSSSSSLSLSPAANELLLPKCALTAAAITEDQQFVAPTPPQQQLLLPVLTKQTFSHNRGGFIAAADDASSPTLTTAIRSAGTSLIYQVAARDLQQQQQQQLQQALLTQATLSSISPPLDQGQSSGPQSSSSLADSDLPAFFSHDQTDAFYEGVATYKKEFEDVLLTDASVAAATAGLSDESMMEAIDWWEAHTPKSDNGSLMI